MTPDEESRVKEWHATLAHPVAITLEMTRDKRSADLKSFCDELAEAAPAVRVSRQVKQSEKPPSIHVSPRLRYQAIPLGHELAPFLEALSSQNNPEVKIEAADVEKLRNLKSPVAMKLYVMQQCPVCPQAVRQMTPLTRACESIQLSVIDGMLFFELAQSDRIQGAPTLVLDEVFRWTGPLKPAEVVDTLIHRDPAKLGPDTLKNILLEGRALQLAAIMLEREQIFPAFLDLLTHHRLPVRLGAMVAMEQVIEKDRALANTVAEPLWERFPLMEDAVKGDVLYIFGLLRNRRMIPRLQAVLEGSYSDDVKEAAEEALDKITGVV